MSKKKYPVTPAIRMLRQFNADFETYEYEYKEKGGTSQSASELGVDEYRVIKTLIFTSEKELLCVLMHGNMEVSVKKLAAHLNLKHVSAADENKALNATGYRFGGTSPFGLKKQLPIYAEKSIFSLDKIFINGGKQGFLIEIEPNLLKKILNVQEINVAISK